MTLDELKNLDRFVVMEKIKSWNDISAEDIEEVMEILQERQIGIPKNIYVQRNKYKAELYGYGLKGYFIGTQSLKNCTILWVPLLILVFPVSIIIFGALTSDNRGFVIAYFIDTTIKVLAFRSFYVCRHNHDSRGLGYLVFLICSWSLFTLIGRSLAVMHL